MNEHTEYDEKLKDDGERSGSRMTAGDEQALVALADLFKVFGDPTRTRILGCLQNGSLCVGEIAEAHSISPQGVSDTLKRAERTLIETERKLKMVEKSDKLRILLDEMEKYGDERVAQMVKKAKDLLDN